MITLKSIRENHHYTQKQVADLIGVKERTYAAYEKQIPNIDLSTASRLCDVLEITLTELDQIRLNKK